MLKWVIGIVAAAGAIYASYRLGRKVEKVHTTIDKLAETIATDPVLTKVLGGADNAEIVPDKVEVTEA